MKYASLIVLALVGAAHAQPASYDLRAVVTGSGSFAWVPAIQDQGDAEDCWTFASATAMNSNLQMQGLLAASAVAPVIQISSWHLSTRNGTDDQLEASLAFSGSLSNWGGNEYQALGYVTRGAGEWTIPGTSHRNPNEYITQMGGGPVLDSAQPNNAFPSSIANSSGYPSNLSSLLPQANQPQAYKVTAVVMFDQGFSNNVNLPSPTGTVTLQQTTYSTYDFNLGANDPQVQAVKQGILQYGAVTTSMNANSYDMFHFIENPEGASVPYTVEYINHETATQFSDHEVTIIGWDDNYQIIGTGTTYTGAWLVQNSWGTSGWTGPANANDGTFWAPYNDAVIGRSGVAAFQLDNILPNQVVLQNELGPMEYAGNYTIVGGTSPAYTGSPLGMGYRAENEVASILTPNQDGLLVALGLATQVGGVTVKVQIFDDWLDGAPENPLLNVPETFTLDGIGYYEFALTGALSLTNGDSIVVMLTYLDENGDAVAHAVPIVIGGTGLYGDSNAVIEGLSYYFDGADWHDFAHMSFDTYSSSTEGGILFLKGITVVPEPGSLVLALGGLVFLASRRRPA